MVSEIVEADGSKFQLVTANDDQESSTFKCEICGKAIQKCNIKKHITTKTHRDRLGSK